MTHPLVLSLVQKLQNRSLWEIHAEERLVFDARVDLVSLDAGL